MAVWIGDSPKNCDLCKTPLKTFFIDGRVRRYGSWACMCPSCHAFEGVGLGQGHGQKYQFKKQQWYKVEG